VSARLQRAGLVMTKPSAIHGIAGSPNYNSSSTVRPTSRSSQRRDGRQFLILGLAEWIDKLGEVRSVLNRTTSVFDVNRDRLPLLPDIWNFWNVSPG
jgi:hypothetical protein